MQHLECLQLVSAFSRKWCRK